MARYKRRLTKTDKRVGGKVRRLRKQREFTQEELAEIVNVSSNYISYIENGKRRPSLALLRKIAKALKTNLPELLSGGERS